jgi:glutamate 5-kinase
LKQPRRDYKRIVIKVGSSLLYSKNNALDFAVFGEIALQVINLVKNGKEAVIVSSGAIALGMYVLGLKERPKKISDLQAAAAIGQNELMNTYRKNFDSTGCFGAQILLTYDDFDERYFHCSSAGNTACGNQYL